jgi:hypothetical protein
VPGLHDGRCHNDKRRWPGIFSTHILTGYVRDPARSNFIAKVSAPAWIFMASRSLGTRSCRRPGEVVTRA